MQTPAQQIAVARGAGAAPLARYTEELYVYEVPPIGPINDGADATQALQLQNDADFVISEINAFASDGAGAKFTPDAMDATLQIYDTGVGANLFSQPVPLASIAGTGQRPFILPTRRVVAKSATLQVTVDNVHTGANMVFYISFIGSKLRPRPTGQ